MDTTGFVTTSSERIAEWDKNAFPYNYWRTTFAPPDVVANLFTGPEHYVDQLAMVRMRLIELALLDFKREHHKLPDSLHELVPAYFEKLPIDPWGGREFIYEPKGIPGPLHFKNLPHRIGNSFSGQCGHVGCAARPAAEWVVQQSCIVLPTTALRVSIRLVSRDGDRIAWFGSSWPDSEEAEQGNAFRVTFRIDTTGRRSRE